jgi:hypothetical protein
MMAPMTTALLIAGAFVVGFGLSAALAAIGFKVLIDVHKEERELVGVEREQWRSERRELINRQQFPHVMPTGTERPEPRQRTEAEIARQRDWAQVGRVVSVPDGETRLP